MPLCQNEAEIICSQRNQNIPATGCIKNCEGIHINSYLKTEIQKRTRMELKKSDFIQEYENYKGKYAGEWNSQVQ